MLQRLSCIARRGLKVPGALKSSNSKVVSRSFTNVLLTGAKPAAYRMAAPTMGARFMSTTFQLESLGDSITTAVLLNWTKEAGDGVAEDDVLGVVETDKVTMDIRSKVSGVWVEALCAPGDEIEVGGDIYKIDTTATAAPAHSESVEEKEVPAAAPAGGVEDRQTVEVPIMGESITTGVMAEWAVAVGDYVEVDQVVASIETDKVTVEVRSPFAGAMLEIFNGDGDEVEVGAPLFSIDAGAAPPAGGAKKTEEAPKTTAAAPAAAAAAPVAAPVKAAAAAPSKAPTSTPTTGADEGDRSETRVKMTRMRVRIAQRLKESQNTAAMLTTFQEVDMGTLIAMRNKYKETFEKTHGVKLGFMSAFVQAATAALQEIPAVNGVIDDNTNEIVYRNYVDISVAVASPTGLVVPVLRNTEKMNFADVEKTIGMYGAKAKAGQMALEDMTGGTFTISNGGVFGSLMGTPIINPPQSAILGMHATKMRPMAMPDGSIEVRPMMYLALTYDHRLIDGREAVTFLKTIQNKIEDPHRMLLQL